MVNARGQRVINVNGMVLIRRSVSWDSPCVVVLIIIALPRRDWWCKMGRWGRVKPKIWGKVSV